MRDLRPLLWFALVTGLCVGAAKLGIELPVARGVITPVWAPSGIALAALLILGNRYWPAIAVGAFVANATSDASLALPPVSPSGTRSRRSSAQRSSAGSVSGSPSIASAPFSPSL